MTRNNIIISSLAMDLKRVALAYYNKSEKTAEIFSREVLNRLHEVDKEAVSDYIIKCFSNLPASLSLSDKSYVAENALMYSTIFQNYIIKQTTT